MGGGRLDKILPYVISEADEPPSEDASSYCRELAGQVLARQAWADDVITAKLEHWELARVTLIDRLILELALVEMVNFEDVPLKVSISEAIEIAKHYSTDESPGFVNGILDAIYHDILDGKLSAE